MITGVVAADGRLEGNVAAGGISTDGHPAINGTGHAGNTINVYDNTTLLGTTVVDSNGKWSYQPVAALSDGAHNLHTTTTNSAGTSDASNTYAFKVTQIMVTGVSSDGVPVAQGGMATGTVTITGWIADPALAADAMTLYMTGGNLGPRTVRLGSTVTVSGHTFTAVVSHDSALDSMSPVMTSGTYHIDARALGASTDIITVSDARLGWTFTDTWSNASAPSLKATHADASAVAVDVAAVHALSSQHADDRLADSEHKAINGATGDQTVDLSADPASYFKDATAHIQGGTGGVNTLHLTGDHQVLDLTSLTGKTAAAKVSGIEAIDLGGAHNALKLSLVDVLNLGEPDLFQKDGKHQILVSGSNGDSVDLSNSHVAGVTEGHWMQEGTAVVSGVTYNVYEHSGAHAELLVQQGVQIALHG